MGNCLCSCHVPRSCCLSSAQSVVSGNKYASAQGKFGRFELQVSRGNSNESLPRKYCGESSVNEREALCCKSDSEPIMLDLNEKW